MPLKQPARTGSSRKAASASKLSSSGNGSDIPASKKSVDMTGVKSSNSRSERKKAQNRISQQCLREKNFVHAKQLESLTELIKSSANPDATFSLESQRALMNNQLALIEENKNLRDALLRMRKKLLSLSFAVAAVADDQIFDKVLQKPSPKRKFTEAQDGEDSDSTDDTATAAPSIPLQTEVPLSKDDTGKRQKTTDYDGIDVSEMYLHQEPASAECGASASTYTTNEDIPKPLEMGHVASDAGDFSLFSKNDGLEYMMNAQDSTLLQFTDFFTANETFMPGWQGISPPAPSNFMSSSNFVSSSNFFEQRPPSPNFVVDVSDCWKVEEACLKFLAKRIGLPLIDDGMSTFDQQPAQSRYDYLRTTIASIDSGFGTVARVAKIGTYLICRYAGFSSYVYGVGAHVFTERILRWRLSPSAQNRAAIPEPFKPTPLQYTSKNYPIAIDMINWPTIRDQLILKAATIDLNKVIADIVANTVLEFPSLQVTLNIHDIFVTQVFGKPPNMEQCGRAVDFAEQMTDPDLEEARGQPMTGWTGNDALEQLSRKMAIIESQGIADPTMFALQPNLAGATRMQPLCSKFGIDNVLEWKLSREFAAAHPSINCDSVTASHPMCPSQAVAGILLHRS